MGINLGSIAQLVGNAVGPATQVIAARRQAQIAAAIQQRQQEQQAEKDAIAQALTRAQTGHLNAETDALRVPKPTPRDPVADANARWDYELAHPKPATPKGPNAQQHLVDPVTGEVTFFDPMNPPKGLKVNPAPKPPPQQAFTFPTVTGPNGDKVIARANTKTGSVEPTTIGAPSPGNGMGAASITQKIATNKQQLAVIDDALKELNAHPDAVGLQRGVPFLGDMLNQRVDPAGVPARASIANIGSLQIHDRTGASMTVHEEPRLAPFVPSVKDTPQTVRVKLGKLRQALLVINAELQAGATLPAGGGRRGGRGGDLRTPEAPSSGDPEFDAIMANVRKRKP